MLSCEADKELKTITTDLDSIQTSQLHKYAFNLRIEKESVTKCRHLLICADVL